MKRPPARAAKKYQVFSKQELEELGVIEPAPKRKPVASSETFVKGIAYPQRYKVIWSLREWQKKAS